MNAPQEKNALIKVGIPSLAMSEAELVSVLQSSLYPGAKTESIKLVIGYCKAGGFDPMQKPVHIVPMSVKTGAKNQYGDDEYVMRDVIMPGVGLYRTLAARTEEYAGMTEPEFGPTKTISFKDLRWEKGEKDKNVRASVDAELAYPEWCKVTVRRLVQGNIVEFSAKEYWLENYATAGKSTTAPNAMWKKRPFGQLAKCAEAQALRKGFPEAGAEPTADEMAGKSLDDGVVIDHGTGEITRTAIAQPQSKTSSAQASSESQVQPGTEGSAGPAPAATTNGKKENKPEPKPLTKGMVGVIEAKMANATLSSVDFHKKFGCKLEIGVLLDPNTIIDWINNPSGK